MKLYIIKRKLLYNNKFPQYLKVIINHYNDVYSESFYFATLDILPWNKHYSAIYLCIHNNP